MADKRDLTTAMMTNNQLEALAGLADQCEAAPNEFAHSLAMLAALDEAELWALAGMLLDRDISRPAEFVASYAAQARAVRLRYALDVEAGNVKAGGEPLFDRLDPRDYWRIWQDINADIEAIIAKVEAGSTLQAALADDGEPPPF